MSKEQNVRKYLDIPGEKQLIYTFKFNMDLPPPVPQPKTMFVPLDPERYVKPKLTLLHVKRKPVIFTDINLNIPIDEINMKPELYNPAADANTQLSAKDRELIEEKAPQDIKKKKTPLKGTTEAAAPAAAKENKQAVNNVAKAKPETPAPAKKPEPTSATKKKEEPKKLSYNDYIKKSFEIAKSYKTDFKHSSKDGLTCVGVMDVLPDIQNLINDLFVVKTEVSTDTLKTKENLLKFDIDTDKKPVLGIYTKTSLFGSDEPELKKKTTDEMEEEVEGEKKEPEISPELANNPLFKKLENFTFVGNYVYSQPKPHGQAKKDLLLNVNSTDGKTFVYPTQPLIIKKKKAMFVNKPTLSNKEEEQDEDKRPKEVQKSIKLIRKEQDKSDLLLRKRRFEELSLQKTPFSTKNKELLDNYQEEEDEEELETLRKTFIKEEEEEEEVPEEEGGSNAVEEEREEEADADEEKIGDDNQSRDVNSERDVDAGEEEEQYKGSDAGEGEKKMEEEEVPEPVVEKPIEEEKPVAEEKPAAKTEDKISTFKRPKSDSEDDAVNEISKFFESSDEDSD